MKFKVGDTVVVNGEKASPWPNNWNKYIGKTYRVLQAISGSNILLEHPEFPGTSLTGGGGFYERELDLHIGDWDD